jgi:hypothetical protein
MDFFILDFHQHKVEMLLFILVTENKSPLAVTSYFMSFKILSVKIYKIEI